MIATLNFLLSKPTRSNTQPFDADFGTTGKTDALQTIFNAVKDTDSVFLFTDGDSRKLHPAVGDPLDPKANSTSKEVADLFKNKTKSFKTFSFLLCTRSIESNNNWFIKDTWNNINDNQKAISDDRKDMVYGLEQLDLNNKTVLNDTISKMLSDWSENWFSKSENGYVIRGSGWLVGGNVAPVSNVIPGLLRLRYGAISFDTGILNMKIQADGNPVPPLDTDFPEFIDDFIQPVIGCGYHSLDFDFTQPTPIPMTDYVFYWWWADTPTIYVDSGQPLVLYNNNNEHYDANVKVSSSLNNEFLKNINGNTYSDNDLNNFSRCLRFYVPINGQNYPLEYKGDGNLLLSIINPFAAESVPLPNGNGNVPVTFLGVWNGDSNPLFSIESQNTNMVKIRYYPVESSTSISTPTPGISPEILKIPLDFFHAKYYPQTIFPNESWQPAVKFAGNGCPPILMQPVEPPYPPGGGPEVIYDVKTIQASPSVESELDVTIYMDENSNVAKCDQLSLSWTKWTADDDWKKPDDINLGCNLKTFLLYKR
jgi:hypothetical protein